MDKLDRSGGRLDKLDRLDTKNQLKGRAHLGLAGETAKVTKMTGKPIKGSGPCQQPQLYRGRSFI